PVGGVHELGGELLGHTPPGAAPRVTDDPAPRQRLTAIVPDLDRHLVGRTAYALGLDLEDGRDVAHRLVEDVQRLLARGAPDLFECLIDDPLGQALLALEHEAVDELGQSHVGVYGIGQDGAFGDAGSARHGSGGLLALGAVLAASLLAVLGAGRVEGAADDVIAHAGQVLDAAAPDEHHRVLLQVM